jgi:hypothetical protein
LEQWSSAFTGTSYPHKKGTDTDEYNEPVNTNVEWWKDLPIKEVLIVAGGDEVLLDGVKAWESVFRKGFEAGGGKVEFIIAKDGYHDQPMVDINFGFNEGNDSEQSKAIKNFFSSKL